MFSMRDVFGAPSAFYRQIFKDVFFDILKKSILLCKPHFLMYLDNNFVSSQSDTPPKASIDGLSKSASSSCLGSVLNAVIFNF